MARPKTLEPTVSRAYRVMFTHRRRGYEVGIIAAVENIEEAERAAWEALPEAARTQLPDYFIEGETGPDHWKLLDVSTVTCSESEVGLEETAELIDSEFKSSK